MADRKSEVDLYARARECAHNYITTYLVKQRNLLSTIDEKETLAAAFYEILLEGSSPDKVTLIKEENQPFRVIDAIIKERSSCSKAVHSVLHTEIEIASKSGDTGKADLLRSISFLVDREINARNSKSSLNGLLLKYEKESRKK